MILHQIAHIRHVDLAPLIPCDPTKISKFTGGQDGGSMSLEQFSNLLPALNLGLVECEGGSTVTIPRDEYKALQTLARKALGQGG